MGCSRAIWHGVNHKNYAIGKHVEQEQQVYLRGIEYFFRTISNEKCAFPISWTNAYRLRLADILVRPMQRLTKYSLLLTAIRKHITDENDAEIMDAMVNDDL